MLTYYIYDKIDDNILPDKKLFHNKIQYRDLFHLTYFEHNNNWKKKYGKKVTYSNYQKYSKIKNYLPHINKISLKHRLYKLIRNKKYALDYIYFDINTDYHKLLQNKIKLNNNELWFVKKSSNLTYGGYDVYPIKTDSNFFSNLNNIIQKSNSIVKYAHHEFVLQKGISNPLLIHGKKFDVRMYGLICYTPTQYHFYFFKIGLIRKTLQKYNADDLSLSNQLTNTTFNRQNLETNEMYILTELLDENHKLYIYYPKFKQIYKSLCKIITKKINPGTLSGYQLLGLDYIITQQQQVFLLEVNRHPAIYYEPDKITNLHKGYDYKIFNDTFFDLTINAIINNNFIKHDTTYYDYIFYS